MTSDGAGSPRGSRATRHLALAVIATAVAALPALTTFGALVTTDRYIVTEDATLTEDQYVTALTASVEGTIEGDLTVFSGSVTISGTVTGSVHAFSTGRVEVTPTGSIGGSLDGSATNLSIHGHIGSDVFFAAGAAVIEETATVDRDVIMFGGSTRVEGTVGRDVRGRVFRIVVDGTVGGDVDVATQSLTVGPAAEIDGDVLYRSPSDASIADGAQIVGSVTRLPTQGNFVYGLMLTLANVVGFLGFAAAGLLVLWIARGTGSRATGAILTKPIRSLLAGVAFVIVVPLVVAFLAITLVGIPLAVIVVAGAIVAFIVGAVPAVSALGNRILVGRGGLFGAFLVGAVVWRLGIWLIPWVGAFLFVLGLVWGLGGWVLGALAARRSDPLPASLLPPVVVDRAAVPAWEPPLAPGAAAIAPPEEVLDGAEANDGSEPDDDPVPDEGDGGSERGETQGADDAPAREPNPSAERDRSQLETTVSFEGSESPPPHPSTEERFAALREELANTGDVKPVPGESSPSDRDDPDRDRGSDGWGLPDR